MLSKETWKTSNIRSLNNENESAHTISENELQKELSLFANTRFVYKNNYDMESYENNENIRLTDIIQSPYAPNFIQRDPIGERSNESLQLNHTIDAPLRSRANIPFIPDSELYISNSRLGFDRSHLPQDDISQAPQFANPYYTTENSMHNQPEHFSSLPCSPTEIRQNPMNILYLQDGLSTQSSLAHFPSISASSSTDINEEDEANNNSEDDSNQSQETQEPNKIDKRRRNTAASARFRVKKKIREQFLQKTLDEKTESAEKLQNRIVALEREIKWLKDLIMEKDSKKSIKET